MKESIFNCNLYLHTKVNIETTFLRVKRNVVPKLSHFRNDVFTWCREQLGEGMRLVPSADAEAGTSSLPPPCALSFRPKAQIPTYDLQNIEHTRSAGAG